MDVRRDVHAAAVPTGRRGLHGRRRRRPARPARPLATILTELASAPEMTYMSVIELPRLGPPAHERHARMIDLFGELLASGFGVDGRPPPNAETLVALPRRKRLGDASAATPPSAGCTSSPRRCPPSATSASARSTERRGASCQRARARRPSARSLSHNGPRAPWFSAQQPPVGLVIRDPVEVAVENVLEERLVGCRASEERHR